jgi:Rad3-related DNA helicase
MKNLIKKISAWILIKYIQLGNYKTKSQKIEILENTNKIIGENNLQLWYELNNHRAFEKARILAIKDLELKNRTLQNEIKDYGVAQISNDKNIEELNSMVKSRGVTIEELNIDNKLRGERIAELIRLDAEKNALIINLKCDLENKSNELSKNLNTLESLCIDNLKLKHDTQGKNLRVSYIPMFKNFPAPNNRSDFEVTNNQYADKPEYELEGVVRVVWFEGQNDE